MFPDSPPAEMLRTRSSCSLFAPTSLATRSVGRIRSSVRRSHGAVLPPSDALELAGGDTVVLSGRPEALALAEKQLLES